MKLPRYYKAQSVVGELSRRDSISPGLAASTQLAKYSAIAAGASAIGDVAAGIAEIKADEEYTDSVTTYESALTSIDQGMDNIVKTGDDQFGNPVFDSGEMMNMEREARTKLANDVRSGMKSGSAKRQFDKHVANSRIDRERVVGSKMAHKEAVFIEHGAITKVQTFIATDNFAGATARNDAAWSVGAIGAKTHAAL